MKNKPDRKEIENKLLEELNDFMKDFNIKEIEFGKTHKLKKTRGKKAKDITTKRK